MAFLSPALLEFNRQHVDLQEDFFNSNRTGQCHAVCGTKLVRLGISHIPESETDPKTRYHIVANNKFNCLLANPSASRTGPYTDEEKKIFAGGVRAWERIMCVSGFHPKVDEAAALIFGWTLFWSQYDIYAIIDADDSNIYASQILTKIGGTNKLLSLV